MRGSADAILPPLNRDLVTWMEQEFYLGDEGGGGGKWHAYPYQRGIMEAITDRAIEQVTVMKSARIGWTKIITGAIGRHITDDPCNILVVQPRVEDAEGWSKDELAPMIRDVPAIRARVDSIKTTGPGRPGSNTILKKQFPGGQVMVIGATSPRGFRRISARVVLFDEVDAYDPEGVGEEGDPIELGRMRTFAQWNRKILIGSTPTIKGISRIERLFGLSDQRYYFVPCPTCGHFHILEWGNFVWPKGRPRHAVFECPRCSNSIPYSRQRDIVEAGEWRATDDVEGHAGFHIWAAYSFAPGAAWGRLAQEWSDIIHSRDKQRQKTYTQQVMGETWEETGDTVEDSSLMARVEQFGTDPVPAEVLGLTVGADVQPDRIEAELVGWGVGQETWSLEHKIVYGDITRPEVWQEFDVWLAKQYETEDGRILVSRVSLIDANFQATIVHNFCEGKRERGIYPCRGEPGPQRPIAGRPKRSGTRKTLLVHVGTYTAKELIYGRLALDTPGPGYCHMPAGRGAEWFEQLTNEKGITKYVKGIPQRQWVPKKPGARSEALDCRVYAMAAFELWRPDLEALASNIDQIREKQQARRREHEQSAKQETVRASELAEQIDKRRKSRRPGPARGFATSW